MGELLDSDFGAQPCHRSHCRSASPDGVPIGNFAALRTASGPSTNMVCPSWLISQSPADVTDARKRPPGPRNVLGRPCSGTCKPSALITSAIFESKCMAANCRQLGSPLQGKVTLPPPQLPKSSLFPPFPRNRRQGNAAATP